MKRKTRYIEGRSKYKLAIHKAKELGEDFDIETVGFYILAPLTKGEWKRINN